MKYEPLPKYGTHMTLKSFIEHCETGCFIDYDGFGQYATKTQMTDKVVIPSHITGRREDFNMKTGKFKMANIKKKIDRRFKYVMWFNK